MSEAAGTGWPRVRTGVAGALIVASYAILGSILVWTRSVGLDRSYWHDEILTVRDSVTTGPREILAGPYIANNHELFSLLSWATISAVGESEVVLRLWSVIPFVLGVLLVTTWLHIRLGAVPGVLFLYFATLSPLLLDLTRQARGYGLAFLAMSVLIVAALEADHSGRTSMVVAFCAAGLVGTWTLPNFAIAFVATGAVLVTNRQLRLRTGVGLVASVLAIGAWYAPHVDDLRAASQERWGAPIPWFGAALAPFEQILIPALLWIEGSILTTSFIRLPLVAAVAFVILWSPLLREQRAALVLSTGVAATLLVVWATRLYLSPRFVSFLLVPLFILLATGVAHLLERSLRRPNIEVILAFTVLALVAVAFVSAAMQVTQLPREAHRDAAEIILERAPRGAPVLAYTYRPKDLEFYLGEPVQTLEHSEVVSSVCGTHRAVVFVTQPLGAQSVAVPCLHDAGVSHYRFEQYSQGGEINVWLVPSRH